MARAQGVATVATGLRQALVEGALDRPQDWVTLAGLEKEVGVLGARIVRRSREVEDAGGEWRFRLGAFRRAWWRFDTWFGEPKWSREGWWARTQFEWQVLRGQQQRPRREGDDGAMVLQPLNGEQGEA